jgi:phosphoribosylformimino-5-aminoimidazole carboxamide ribotide isomerase
VIYTDISKDGKEEGTNLEAYERLVQKDLNIVASGGITHLHELTQLQDMGIYGAILGKALYTGKIKLEEALALLSQ